MTDLERARKVFATTTYATEVTGCVIEEVRPGYAVCSLALEPRHMNTLGVPMGGAVFTLADFAFGVASNFDRDVYVSRSADVHFLASSRARVLRAEAKEVRSGRRACLFTVTVTDDQGVQTAYITIAGVKVQARRKKPAGLEEGQ